MNKQKIYGQVFTPFTTAELMLDLAGFVAGNPNLLDTKLLEPSSGEGVFLLEIVSRVIKHAAMFKKPQQETLDYLNTNVHAVELDAGLHQHSVEALNNLLKTHGYSSIPWNSIKNENALLADLPNDFDLVVGNPPYVRVHNMDEETRRIVKTFDLTTGSTDLYIAFMEKGLRALSKTGRMVFITPNSFMKNSSQKKLRELLISERRVETVINYRSSKVFEDADTYAAITILTAASDREAFSYQTWNGDEKHEAEILFDAITPTGREWNFGYDGGNILKQQEKPNCISDIAHVAYGVATLRDRLYIDPSPVDNGDGTTGFNGGVVETAILQPVVKVSTYKGGEIKGRILFPYSFVDGRYRAVSEEVFKTDYPLAYAYLTNIREDLDKRAMEQRAMWFQFGRSQGLSHIQEEKIVMPPVIKTGEAPAVYRVPADTVVYSGFYLTPKEGHSIEEVSEALLSEGIAEYLSSSGQDMSGGYISYKARTVREFRF